MCSPASAELFQVESTHDGLLARFTSRSLDETSASDLAQVLFSLVPEESEGNLYLDFGEVVFLASGTLGELILLNRQLRDAGGQLFLVGLNPPIAEVFRVSLLTDLLNVRVIPESPVLA